jgi:intracellular sulfur oxidation DsrE/DsrF family protein
MKKLLFITACLLFAYSAQAQYYPFGSNFKYSFDSKDSLDFVDAKNKLVATMDNLQKEGEVYFYEVNFRINKMDEGDSANFMVMVLAKDEAEFDAAKQAWETANPEVLNFLSEKSPERKDEKLWNKTLFMPVIKSNSAMVINVDGVDHKPDLTLKYNIVVDFTVFAKEDTEDENSEVMKPDEVNWGLGALGRLMNLHVGAGIPQENVKIVAAVHGVASDSFLTNEAYNARYKMDNPNIALLNQLSAAGIEFWLCGQSLGETEKKDLLPMAKVAFTAQIILSEYQMKGYALKVLMND